MLFAGLIGGPDQKILRRNKKWKLILHVSHVIIFEKKTW